MSPEMATEVPKASSALEGVATTMTDCVHVWSERLVTPDSALLCSLSLLGVMLFACASGRLLAKVNYLLL
jgi:hypothetical protein